MQTHIISTEKRERLDTYLASLYPAVSRSFLQKLCATDQILVNENPEKAGFKLKDQDKVTVLYDIAGIDDIESIELPILYEDDDVLVINKPTGVISHARGKYWNEPSVASFIRQHSDQSGERAGIVHRLDRVTSGVMICAKTQEALQFLQKEFADRTVTKTYLAVVDGHLKPESAIIDMPIERNPKLPSTFRVGPNGKKSQTIYKVLESNDMYDLVELIPKTGRTHQLRVHMKQQGHVIVGDVLYGAEKADRLYLHAYSLQITLPSGETKTFIADKPVEFDTIVKG